MGKNFGKESPGLPTGGAAQGRTRPLKRSFFVAVQHPVRIADEVLIATLFDL